MRVALAAVLLGFFASASVWAEESTVGNLPTQVAAAPRTAWTKRGTPGDPLNVVLVGTREDVVSAFCAAGWYPADPITPRSAVGISVSVIFNVPYRQAPVSNLYLEGRTQDLAFESPAGRSARRRHHIRLWCSGLTSPDGRPVWLAADTFDASVGRSAATGKITHHIAPNIDRQRDMTMQELLRAERLTEAYLVHVNEPYTSRNGEGDCYFTDGRVALGILAPCQRACLPAVR